MSKFEDIINQMREDAEKGKMWTSHAIKFYANLLSDLHNEELKEVEVSNANLPACCIVDTSYLINALGKILLKCEEADNEHLHNNDKVIYDCIKSIKSIISNAMKKPPRNCDFYNDAETADRAFDNFCLGPDGCEAGECKFGKNSYPYCIFEWMLDKKV